MSGLDYAVSSTESYLSSTAYAISGTDCALPGTTVIALEISYAIFGTELRYAATRTPEEQALAEQERDSKRGQVLDP
eukprot:928525-Rhodomonas_salina.1